MMDSSHLDLLSADELDISLRLSYLLSTTPGGTTSEQDKDARKKEKRLLKEAKVARALEAKKTAAATTLAPEKKVKFVGKGGEARAEVDVNTEVDVASLVSSADLPDLGEAHQFFLTTAINYTNGNPHIGHAYEAVTSDVISRFRRMCGCRVFFQMGSDEHGQKIANSAAREGLEPINICDKYAGRFQDLNKRLLVSNNLYVRTTQEKHKLYSQQLWKICADKDDIYLGKYEGWYDEREERYVTESDAEKADFKDNFGTPLKRMSEDSYFFCMSKYTDWLVQYIKDNPSFIQPETHRSLILLRLEAEDQGDLSVSRTTFDWGIPVPEGFDKKHVMYVWFDALTNYLTGVNALDTADSLSSFWPASVHMIGKDITWFHCVIWPCMLKSAGLPLPKAVFAHGFVGAEDGRKMSKSLGNVVDPNSICEEYPVDTFRWYMCRDATYGCDLSFSCTALVLAHNSELCDTLGNLVHRSLSLMGKYNGGIVPEQQPGFDFRPFDFGVTRKAAEEAMAVYALQDVCACSMEALRDTNKFLQDEEPWKLSGEEFASKRLEIVRICLEAVYAVTHLLVAFIPTAGSRIFEKLGTPPIPIGKLRADFQNIPAGSKLTIGSILYKKLDLPAEDASKQTGAGATAAIGVDSKAVGEGEGKTVEKLVAAGGKEGGKVKKAKESKGGDNGKGSAGGVGGEPDANQDNFTKIDIRVGRIAKVWNHEDADRLYCEEIDVGEGQPRSIASGLREHCTLEEMSGRLVLVVCNLKAAKLAGFLSNGMVLAAKGDNGKVELVRPPVGSTVGERVMVEGLQGEPLKPAQVKKKKAFEALAPDLCTNADRVATFQGRPMVTSRGACVTDSLAGAQIA